MAQSYIDTLLYVLERKDKQPLYLQTLDDARTEIFKASQEMGRPFKPKRDFINARYDDLEQMARSRGMTLRFFNKEKDTGVISSKKTKKSKGQKDKRKAKRSSDKRISLMAHEQMFIQRVKNAIADLWADDGENYDEQYQRGIFELGAMLTQRWDEWVNSEPDRKEIQNWLLGRDVESTPKFPHPVLADVSELLLKAEDRLNDLREYDLSEDEFGVLDVETDVQSLVAKVQGILDAEEASTEEAARRDKNEKEIHYD